MHEKENGLCRWKNGVPFCKIYDEGGAVQRSHLCRFAWS